MIACRRIPDSSRAWAVGLVLCVAQSAALGAAPVAPETGTAAGTSSKDASTSIQMGSILSSLKQAFNHDFDHEVVRGHFDVGTPPDSHRYYCLVDPATGKPEANGVGGETVLRPDGMTAIKSGAVSFYSCGSAEQQGVLVSAGYVIKAGIDGKTGPTSSGQREPAAPAPDSASPDRIDVAGVRLGMTPDQVRSVLRAKRLLDYHESAQTLTSSEAAKGTMGSLAEPRFVNVIAAWTAAEDGESYEVMFTPVPGGERVLAIIHSVAYSPADGVRERAVETALVSKYGGYPTGALPRSPTWRIQSGGTVQVGDPCNRRGIFGGLGDIKVSPAARTNVALKTTPEEFRFQIDHCGTAMVTEDHLPANSAVPGEDRLISRFTVSAYSPSIGLEGATTAMQFIQSARDTVDKAKASPIRPLPNL
ncbi:MAG: hypothetical protein NVS1B6_05230 [Steroidobacteraceae bacterium]